MHKALFFRLRCKSTACSQQSDKQIFFVTGRKVSYEQKGKFINRTQLYNLHFPTIDITHPMWLQHICYDQFQEILGDLS